MVASPGRTARGGPRRWWWLVVALVLVSGCAHDVRARFPAPTGLPTGTLVLTFASPASGVSVAINGVLVVRDQRTEEVVIQQVPTGYAEVALAAGAGEKQFRVWIDSDTTTTVPLGAAGEPPLSWLRQLTASLITIVVYAALH